MAINKVEFGDEVLIDLTEDTVTEGTLLEGETAHDASGNPIRGRAKSATGTATVEDVCEGATFSNEDSADLVGTMPEGVYDGRVFQSLSDNDILYNYEANPDYNTFDFDTTGNIFINLDDPKADKQFIKSKCLPFVEGEITTSDSIRGLSAAFYESYKVSASRSFPTAVSMIRNNTSYMYYIPSGAVFGTVNIEIMVKIHEDYCSANGERYIPFKFTADVIAIESAQIEPDRYVNLLVRANPIVFSVTRSGSDKIPFICRRDGKPLDIDTLDDVIIPGTYYISSVSSTVSPDYSGITISDAVSRIKGSIVNTLLSSSTTITGQGTSLKGVKTGVNFKYSNTLRARTTLGSDIINTSLYACPYDLIYENDDRRADVVDTISSNNLSLFSICVYLNATTLTLSIIGKGGEVKNTTNLLTRKAGCAYRIKIYRIAPFDYLIIYNTDNEDYYNQTVYARRFTVHPTTCVIKYSNALTLCSACTNTTTYGVSLFPSLTSPWYLLVLRKSLKLSTRVTTYTYSVLSMNAATAGGASLGSTFTTIGASDIYNVYYHSIIKSSDEVVVENTPAYIRRLKLSDNTLVDYCLYTTSVTSATVTNISGIPADIPTKYPILFDRKHNLFLVPYYDYPNSDAIVSYKFKAYQYCVTLKCLIECYDIGRYNNFAKYSSLINYLNRMNTQIYIPEVIDMIE